MTSIATIGFALLVLLVCAFQIALALGAPWGHVAMGGRFPGKLPKPMRIAALVQVFLLSVAATFIAIRAGFVLPEFYGLSVYITWGVVILMGISLVMNLASPSKLERLIWSPVAALLLACSTVVALS